MMISDIHKRAYFLFERDRFHDAASICLEGLAVDPQDLDLLYLRGLCGLRLKDRDLVQSSVELLAESAPDWACTHDLLGYQAIEQKQFDSAERHSREAIRRDPETGSRYGVLAYIYERLGRREEAITAARKGLSLAPNSLQLLTQLQILYQLNGEPELAFAMEKRAGEVNPEDPDWHLFAGFRLLEAGQIQAGRSRLRSSLMAEPNIPDSRLDVMASEIVRSHWPFRNAVFLGDTWEVRLVAAATPFVWFALGFFLWSPFNWLGWISLCLVVGWFAYEFTFWMCCRLVKARIRRGHL